ncbi:MAG: hypothetical protein RLZZ435_965, partial [Cyanobacteriota bacterium]
PVALAKYPFFDPIQSLIDRYGLTGRWLVSASAGVFCIMILAPTFAGWMFSFESNAQDLWFQSQGTMVEGHRLQIEESFRDDQTLPDAQFMIDQFPTLWADLYLSPSSSDPT